MITDTRKLVIMACIVVLIFCVLGVLTPPLIESYELKESIMAMRNNPTEVNQTRVRVESERIMAEKDLSRAVALAVGALDAIAIYRLSKKKQLSAPLNQSLAKKCMLHFLILPISSCLAFGEEGLRNPLANVQLEKGAYVLFTVNERGTKFQRPVAKVSDPEVVQNFFDLLKQSPVGPVRRFLPDGLVTTNFVILNSKGMPYICVRYDFTIPAGAFPRQVDLVKKKLYVKDGLLGPKMYLLQTNDSLNPYREMYEKAVPLLSNRNMSLVSPRLRKE